VDGADIGGRMSVNGSDANDANGSVVLSSGIHHTQSALTCSYSD
jgi:hypothetical protein